MMTSLLLLIALAAPQQGPGTLSPDLAAAKELYTSAAYEEALTHLSGIKDAVRLPQVQQYRALCLLALGRTDEAEQALERIVRARPFYRMNEADVSPRMITLFQDVRRRMLPAAARDLYGRAKASFNAEAHEDARQAFKDLIALTEEADFAPHAGDLADLTLVAEGFLALTEAALKPPPPPPAPPTPVEPPPPPTPAQPLIYSVENEDVTPPGDIERRLPPWDASNPVLAATARRGILEVIIDERGRVESAILRQPVAPAYDQKLLDAAKKWRFTPATKDGKPVKFRRLFAISLTGD